MIELKKIGQIYKWLDIWIYFSYNRDFPIIWKNGIIDCNIFNKCTNLKKMWQSIVTFRGEIHISNKTRIWEHYVYNVV